MRSTLLEQEFCTLAPAGAGTRELWRALWDKSPQRSPFSTFAYAEAVQEHLRYPFTVFGLPEKGDQSPLQAGLIVFERRRGPYVEVVVPPLTQYSPLLLSTPLDDGSVNRQHSILDQLLNRVESQYGKLSIHLHPSISDARGPQWRGWKVSPLYTYKLRLHDEDTIQASWSNGTRRAFKKGVTDYVVDEQPEAAETVANLCSESYKRNGRRFPVGVSAATKLINRLQQSGFCRVFLASRIQTREPEAGLAVLHDGNTAYYWIAGSRPGNAMTVLLGRVLPILNASGLNEFDFVGANTPSIAEFKRRFGGVLTSYFRITTITRPELRFLYRLLGRS